MEEYILCAAIWYKELPTSIFNPINVDVGTVVCAYRHHECIHVMVSLTGKHQKDSGKYVQGFLTSKNRFVDRVEAAQIALSSNQIKKLKYSSTELYSEDLY